MGPSVTIPGKHLQNNRYAILLRAVEVLDYQCQLQLTKESKLSSWAYELVGPGLTAAQRDSIAQQIAALGARAVPGEKPDFSKVCGPNQSLLIHLRDEEVIVEVINDRT